MRHITLAAVLLITGCATTAEKKPEAAPAAATAAAPAAEAPAAEAPKAEAPAAEAPAAAEPKPADGGLPTVEFASVSATKAGGTLNDTRYSEKPDDAAITEKKFENGVVTYTGQLGFGKGSAWAGFGFGVNIHGDAAPVDLSTARTVTFHLASPTARSLRLRIVGPDPAIQNAGCYPIVMQPVSAEMTEYVIPVAKFAPEGWCGPNARTVQQTAPQAIGFEIVDVQYQRAPSTFSVGTIKVE